MLISLLVFMIFSSHPYSHDNKISHNKQVFEIYAYQYRQKNSKGHNPHNPSFHRSVNWPSNIIHMWCYYVNGH